ncbi:hypothetical protein [Streptomyces griseosporeus]|uniref:hypothetical protein n=1 Tax=Streptomyces griseosporeus TaxID=1910 RepID=UPI0036F6F436
MESRLQQKLRERRERVALDGILSGLGDLLTGQALEAGTVPAWVPEAIARTWELSTDPAELLPADTPPAEVDAWVEALLVTHAFTDRLYVATHQSIRPWLECRVPPHGWTPAVRAAVEEPWMFLSVSLDTLLIVSEAEHYYEVYVARATAQDT